MWIKRDEHKYAYLYKIIYNDEYFCITINEQDLNKPIKTILRNLTTAPLGVDVSKIKNENIDKNIISKLNKVLVYLIFEKTDTFIKAYNYYAR